MILLLHSSGSSPRQWSGLVERLAPRHRVEAPALIGHEEHPGWGGRRPSLGAEIENLLDAIDFDEPVHVVGHSYGGAVAVKAALSGWLDVRSLTVYEPSLFGFLGESTVRYEDSESPIEVGRAICDTIALGRMDDAARTYVDYWSDRGTYATFTDAQRSRLASRMDVVGACFHALFNDDARPSDLHRLSVPALVMSGTRSPRPAQDLCEMVAGNLARGRHHRFDGLQHMGPVTHGARVFPVIEEFIEGVSRPRVRPSAYLPDHLSWTRRVA